MYRIDGRLVARAARLRKDGTPVGRTLPWILVAAALAGGTRPAAADKLLRIPTAERAGWSLEHLERVEGPDEGFSTLTLPLGALYEGFLRYNRDFDRSHALEVGGMAQLIPQSFGFPSIGVGVWDVTNSGPDGRRFFLALTRDFEHDEFLPPALRRLQATVGIGTDRLGGLFAGVRWRAATAVSLLGEYDSRRFNAGLWWSPTPVLTLKGELHNGDPFVGARVELRF